MDVRPVRPTDAPLVIALALDEGSHLVRSYPWPAANPVARSILQTVLLVPLPGRAWIAHDGSDVALLEMQPRQYVIGWDVTRLVTRGNSEWVLPAVVQAGVGHLQSRGVPRLFARCSPDRDDALRALDFHPLAREHVLLGPEVTKGGDSSLPLDSRYRIPPDAWPLHQLEQETTPSPVRQFEGLTSLDWSSKRRDMSEIVVERDGRIVAWIGWGTKPRRGIVRAGMLLHPAHRELGADLLQHALHQAPAGSRLMARVREYQVDTLRAFLDAGFHVVGEETVMVKHAALEPAPAAKKRMRVVSVPSMQTFPIRVDPEGLALAHPLPEQRPYEVLYP